MKTFLDLVLAGEARQDDIDDIVDQWHEVTRRVPWQSFSGCRMMSMCYGSRSLLP